MKRLFALLLVILYCISFVSCANLLGKEETAEVGTTITINEWRTAGESDNFSILHNTAVAIEKFAEGCISTEHYSKDGSKTDSYFYTNIDGVSYKIEKTDDGYVASESDDDSLDSFLTERYTLSDILSLYFDLGWNSIYHKLVYIEECKTYIGLVQNRNQSESVQIEVECEDGNIKEMRLCILGRDHMRPLTGIITFYDFGTTAVEIPEYTFSDQ